MRALTPRAAPKPPVAVMPEPRTMGYSKATGKLMLLDDSTKVGLSVMRTQVQLAGA
jgi:hypothetical protein